VLRQSSEKGYLGRQDGAALAESRVYGGSDGSADLTAAGPGTATMELTSPGSAVGTVAYMSPEQAKGVAAERASRRKRS
jgi:hypothetical protein